MARTVIDLNCDMGELADPATDRAIMPFVTSANIACGFHAGAIMLITAASMLAVSSSGLSNAYGRVDWNKAFFCAENATVWAAQKSFDTPPAAGSSNTYSVLLGTLPTTAVISAPGSDPGFRGAWVSVVQPNTLPPNVVVITSSARINNKIRTLQTRVTIRPVSQVFDYEYFLAP